MDKFANNDAISDFTDDTSVSNNIRSLLIKLSWLSKKFTYWVLPEAMFDKTQQVSVRITFLSELSSFDSPSIIPYIFRTSSSWSWLNVILPNILITGITMPTSSSNRNWGIFLWKPVSTNITLISSGENFTLWDKAHKQSDKVYFYVIHPSTIFTDKTGIASLIDSNLGIGSPRHKFDKAHKPCSMM